MPIIDTMKKALVSSGCASRQIASQRVRGIAALRRSLILFSLAGLVLAGLGACRDKPAPGPPATQPAASQPTPEDVAAVERMLAGTPAGRSPALPADHPPLAPRQARRSTTQPASRPASSTLHYSPPARWKPEPPSSRLYRAQFLVPRSDDDEHDGHLVVSHFPGGGGTVAMNIRRWTGQFSQAGGNPIAPDAVQSTSFEVDGLPVTVVELTGYYAGSKGMGRPATRSDVEYRLLGAVVETPAGPWFFKLTGPAGTVAAAREEFAQMLQSIER